MLLSFRSDPTPGDTGPGAAARALARSLAGLPPLEEPHPVPRTEVDAEHLRELEDLLARASRSSGGLPIALRVELGNALHALERFRADSRRRPADDPEG
jgi:hypothetical protein